VIDRDREDELSGTASHRDGIVVGVLVDAHARGAECLARLAVQ